MEFNKTTKKDLFQIDPRAIVVVDGFNSRVKFDIDELVDSIKQNGVLNPVSVIQEKDKDGNVYYRLVDGERRYRATMEAIKQGADIARIPALCLPRSLNAEELLLQQLLRNEGKPFTDYEMAVVVKKFSDFGYNTSEIAKKISKNVGQVSYWKGIFNYSPEILELFKNDQITHSEFHRIAEAHKSADGNLDEDALLNEIKNGLENAKKKGKERMTIKDLSTDSRTISFRDSKTIKNGLNLLIKYYAKYTNDGEKELELDIMDLYEKLNDGQTIDDIFSKQVEEAA